MKKARVTLRGLGLFTGVSGLVFFITDAQIRYPQFNGYASYVTIVLGIMYLGAWVVVKGQKRD